MGVLLPVLRRTPGVDVRAWLRPSPHRHSRAPRPSSPRARPHYAAPAHAAYAADPRAPADAGRGGPWIRLYSFQSTRGPERAAADRDLARDVRDDVGRLDAARLAAQLQRSAARDAAALRHRLLDVLRAAARLPPTSLPALRRPAADEARLGRRALRRRGEAIRGVREAAARVQARLGGRRPGALLALEAVDRRSHVGAGPTKRLSLGDGWHTLVVVRAEAARHLPVQADGRRPRRQPRVVRGAADRAGARPPAAAAKARARQPRQVGAAAARRRRGDRRPGAGRPGAKLGLRLVRFGVVWPAGAAVPDPALVAALQSVPPGVSVLVELNVGTVPVDDAGRAALAAYAASLATQVPACTGSCFSPQPTAPADSYAAALRRGSRCGAGLFDERAVGAAVDGAQCRRRPSPHSGARSAGVAPDFIAFRPAPHRSPGTGRSRICRSSQRRSTRRSAPLPRSCSTASSRRRRRRSPGSPARGPWQGSCSTA